MIQNTNLFLRRISNFKKNNSSLFESFFLIKPLKHPNKINFYPLEIKLISFSDGKNNL